MNNKLTSSGLKERTLADFCDVPGKPPCPEELKRMAVDMGVNPSYINSISIKDIKNFKPFTQGRNKGGYFIGAGRVGEAVQAETIRRIKNLKSQPGYQVFVNNPNAGPVIQRVNRFINNADKATGRHSLNYQVPTLQESQGLINIGQKYAGSSDLKNDISLFDTGKALALGYNLLRKYPNIKKIADRYR
tara:strand:- start:28 stop:594 length:567 start_codon:yes stop_codon:yes gene_type:complete